MTERVEVFDINGNMTPFDSADEAHRFALRESLYGGRIEDYRRARVQDRREHPTNGRPLAPQHRVRPRPVPAVGAGGLRDDGRSGTEDPRRGRTTRLAGGPGAREVHRVRMWKPSLSDDWFMGAYDGDDLIAMAPGQTFQEAFGAIGVDVEEHLDDG